MAGKMVLMKKFTPDNKPSQMRLKNGQEVMSVQGMVKHDSPMVPTRVIKL